MSKALILHHEINAIVVREIRVIVDNDFDETAEHDWDDLFNLIDGPDSAMLSENVKEWFDTEELHVKERTA